MGQFADEIAALSPREFEHFIADLWSERGWETSVTTRSGDDGIDVIAERNEFYPQKLLIQVKHVVDGESLNRRHIQQYAYLHQKDNVDEVIVVTNGDFTRGAWESAETANIKLIGCGTLIELIKDTAENGQLEELDISLDVSDEGNDSAPLTLEEVNRSDRGKIQRIAASDNVYARLLRTIGLEDYSLEARIGILLQLFRGDSPLHVLLYAEPSDRQAKLLARTTELASPSTVVNCRRVDVKSLLGRYSASGRLDTGLVDDYDRGVIGFARLDENSDIAKQLDETLSQGRYTVTERGYHGVHDTEVSVLATAHPKYGSFTDYDPIGEQLDLPPEVFVSFDFFAIASKNQYDEFLPEMFDKVDGKVEPVSEATLQQHAVLAGEIDPVLTDTAINLIDTIGQRVQEYADEEESFDPVWYENRRETLKRLAKASARVRLDEEVTQADIRVAVAGLPYEATSLPFLEMVENPDSWTYIEEGSFDADVIEAGTSKSQRDRIKKVHNLIEELHQEYDDGAPVEEILNRAEERDMDRSKVEQEIENLKKQGETYEPSPDHLRTL